MRLINTTKTQNFKNWIIQHDPKTKWNFDNPQILKEQFVDMIKQSGDIDLKTIYGMMFCHADAGLTAKQNNRFINKDY
jgi:hypothetical protein